MKKTVGKIKRYNTGTYIIGMSVFIFIAVLLIITDFNMLFTKPENLNKRVKNGFKPKSGEYVSLDINKSNLVGGYAEADYKLYGFIPSGREYYYIVQLSNGAYISVSTRRGQAAKLDSLIKGGNETIVINGVLKEMNEDIQNYYSKTLSAYGYGDEGHVTIYNLTVDSTNGILSTWFLIIASLVITLFFALMLVRSIKFKKSGENHEKDNEAAV